MALFQLSPQRAPQRLDAPTLDEQLSADTPAAPLEKLLSALEPPGVRSSVLSDGSAPLLLLRLDHQFYSADLLHGGRLARGLEDGVTPRDALSHGSAAIHIGSPFVARYSPLRPLGLLQVDGRIWSPVQSFGYTRILGIQRERFGIIGRNAFSPGIFTDALQVGPGIIETGRLDINERELRLPAYFRSFIALCEAETVVGISLRPVHLYHIGERLLGWAREQGLRCVEAVNLSGDRETVLVVSNGRRALLIGRQEVKKTALLTLRRGEVEGGSVEERPDT